MLGLKRLRFVDIGTGLSMMFATAGMLAASALYAAEPVCTTTNGNCTQAGPGCNPQVFADAAARLNGLYAGLQADNCAAPAAAPMAGGPACGSAAGGCAAAGGGFRPRRSPGRWRLVRPGVYRCRARVSHTLLCRLQLPRESGQQHRPRHGEILVRGVELVDGNAQALSPCTQTTLCTNRRGRIRGQQRDVSSLALCGTRVISSRSPASWMGPPSRGFSSS